MPSTRYTWKEFKELVRTLLTTDKDRLGLQDSTDAQGRVVPGYISRLIGQAVLDLQEYIVGLRAGHEDTLQVSDFVPEGKASVGVVPAFGRIREATLIIPSETGSLEYPLKDYPWDLRQELLTGQVDLFDNNGRISISPDGASFLVYPALADGQTARLSWDGKKSDFADTDLVPFPEEAALAVAEFVKGFVAREVDNDLAKFATYFHAREGTYTKARKKLYLGFTERTRTDR